MAYGTTAAEGSATEFLLLSVDNCRLISSVGDPPDSQGTLEIFCVTSDGAATPVTGTPPLSPLSSARSSPVNTPSPEVSLVLRLGDFEMPISPTQPIRQSRSRGTFTFLERPGEKPRSITIVLPDINVVANGQDEYEGNALETLEGLFAQYGVLQELDRDYPGEDGDLKGRLVLVDQDDGEFVGWLGNDVTVTENLPPHTVGEEPVVVEVSEDGTHLEVHPPTAEDKDFILVGASVISQGIIFIGNAVSSGFNAASNLYIKHAKPNANPTQISETTRINVQRVNTASGYAVKATKKTAGALHYLIDGIAKKVGTSGPALSARWQKKKSEGGPPLSRETGTPVPPGANASTSAGGPSQGPNQKKRMVKSVIMSVNMILDAVEQSAITIIDGGGESLSAGIGHKYGPQAGETAQSMHKTARNVTAVYVDAQGFTRRALIKRMGKGMVKARFNKDGTNVASTSTAAQTSSLGVNNAASSSSRKPASGATTPISRQASPLAPIPVPYEPRRKGPSPPRGATRSGTTTPARSATTTPSAAFATGTALPSYEKSQEDTSGLRRRPAGTIPPPLPPREKSREPPPLPPREPTMKS
ncbi:hypothetical protein DL93DRAFT_311555 [Clavulina sp. PMI_390]|nr:hypothetical protein DL93DRAFT_311555 [Clavulina sp. PMI_390]